MIPYPPPLGNPNLRHTQNHYANEDGHLSNGKRAKRITDKPFPVRKGNSHFPFIQQ